MIRARTSWVTGATMLAVCATAAAEPETGSTARPGANDAIYDATGRRDPFRPPRASQTTAFGEARTPLQRYDLGQLRLVAIIYNQNPTAVVEDDAGLGYIVRVGTPIGANGGSVKAIEQGKVRVVEEAVDFYGDRQTSEVVMELADEERGTR
jgi:type IV pilus assembly protein PilP